MASSPDDPAYFGGYIGQNFLESAEALDLNLDDLEKLARNAVTASFLDEGGKANLMARIDH
ncbi:MAG: adenosine deaminase, partial [Xanthomonadaceae bacterium]|nr:adenosine deaminase [Xanthomonadaceae bacterium]